MSVLIDTNLLIYLFDQNDPAKQTRAQEVLEYLETSGLGRLSVQNLAEFISASTRRLVPPLSAEKAQAQATRFAQTWHIFDLTTPIVLEAARGLRQYGLSYYDAQIWATARLNQVSLILSEDFQDGLVLEGVKFINPFSAEFDLLTL